MSRTAFGIDIGGTSIKCGLFDGQGTLLRKDELPTRVQQNGALILGDIRDYIFGVLEEERLDLSGIAGVGLGIPGAVTPDGVVNKCVNLGWGVVNAVKEMAALLKITPEKVCAGNDANMAALGEYWQGSGKGFQSLMLVTVGTGVGGGLIINGQPVNGYHGAAAELGHLPIVTGLKEKCTCKKTGCLEQVASATGIVRLANQQPELFGVQDAKEVFDAAKAGNRAAEHVVETVSYYLAKGLACAAGIADPECFIIGGGVSAAGDYFFDRIRQYYRKEVFHAARETKIIGASLGNDAGMYGAARMVLGKEQQND